MNGDHGDPVNHIESPTMDQLTDQVRVVAHRRLVADDDRVFLALPPGLPISHYLRLVWTQLDGVHARVEIDGEMIERAQWDTYCLNPGQRVTARAIPMGGAAGGKSAIRLIAMIGVVALAAFTAGGGLAPLAGYLAGSGAWAGMVTGSFAAKMTAGAIGIVGSLRVNRLLPERRS